MENFRCAGVPQDMLMCRLALRPWPREMQAGDTFGCCRMPSGTGTSLAEGVTAIQGWNGRCR